MTKRYKLDRVAPVDNRPPPDNNFGPKQMCGVYCVCVSLFSPRVTLEIQEQQQEQQQEEEKKGI